MQPKVQSKSSPESSPESGQYFPVAPSTFMLREILPLIYQGRETGRRSFETEQQAAEYLSVAYLTDKGRYLGPGSHMINFCKV